MTVLLCALHFCILSLPYSLLLFPPLQFYFNFIFYIPTINTIIQLMNRIESGIVNFSQEKRKSFNGPMGRRPKYKELKTKRSAQENCRPIVKLTMSCVTLSALKYRNTPEEVSFCSSVYAKKWMPYKLRNTKYCMFGNLKYKQHLRSSIRVKEGWAQMSNGFQSVIHSLRVKLLHNIRGLAYYGKKNLTLFFIFNVLEISINVFLFTVILVSYNFIISYYCCWMINFY